MVFAFFSISPLEIIILLFMFIALVSPLLIAGVVMLVLRKRSGGRSPDRNTDLENENLRLRERALEVKNQQLREEIARLKRGQGSQDITS